MALTPMFSHNLKKPHVAVLIDGDGAIFNENLVFNSVEGGITAANLLDQGIRHYLWGESDHLQTCDMFAYMFLNKQGLAATMAEYYKEDPRYSQNTLDNFLAGFTQHKLFLAVDAGQHQQAADKKIFERLVVEIQNAEHVILVGIAHDHGYEDVLRQCPGYEMFNHKLHLLKTYKGSNNQGNILRMFNHNIFRIRDLFIKEKLASSPSQSPRRGLAYQTSQFNSSHLGTSFSFGQDSVALSTVNSCWTHFLFGPCNYRSCRYDHSDLDEDQLMELLRDTSKIDCTLWKTGQCPRGNACPFAHKGAATVPELSPIGTPSTSSSLSAFSTTSPPWSTSSSMLEIHSPARSFGPLTASDFPPLKASPLVQDGGSSLGLILEPTDEKDDSELSK